MAITSDTLKQQLDRLVDQYTQARVSQKAFELELTNARADLNRAKSINGAFAGAAISEAKKAYDIAATAASEAKKRADTIERNLNQARTAYGEYLAANPPGAPNITDAPDAPADGGNRPPKKDSKVKNKVSSGATQDQVDDYLKAIASSGAAGTAVSTSSGNADSVANPEPASYKAGSLNQAITAVTALDIIDKGSKLEMPAGVDNPYDTPEERAKAVSTVAANTSAPTVQVDTVAATYEQAVAQIQEARKNGAANVEFVAVNGGKVTIPATGVLTPQTYFWINNTGAGAVNPNDAVQPVLTDEQIAAQGAVVPSSVVTAAPAVTTTQAYDQVVQLSVEAAKKEVAGMSVEQKSASDAAQIAAAQKIANTGTDEQKAAMVAFFESVQQAQSQQPTAINLPSPNNSEAITPPVVPTLVPASTQVTGSVPVDTAPQAPAPVKTEKEISDQKQIDAFFAMSDNDRNAFVSMVQAQEAAKKSGAGSSTMETKPAILGGGVVSVSKQASDGNVVPNQAFPIRQPGAAAPRPFKPL